MNVRVLTTSSERRSDTITHDCFHLIRASSNRLIIVARTHTYTISMLPSQVFSYAKVYLGTGGNQFTGEPVHFSYIPDQVLEQAREVTIKLHSRAGRFLKLQLYFAARWIMLSEVIFESGKRKIDSPTSPSSLSLSLSCHPTRSENLSSGCYLFGNTRVLRVASERPRVMAKLKHRLGFARGSLRIYRRTFS